MDRTMKTIALYALIALPILMILAAKFENLAIIDAIFWRAAVIIFLYLLARLVVTLEKR